MPHDSDTNAQGFGLKKSDFTDQGVTAFDGTATIDVVINGQNVKQSLNNFLGNAQLAVIIAAGDVGATPILETVGATKKIRGIEDGSGILASVSAGNGVLIKHNFQTGSGGVPVFTNITADSPQIGNLIAGSGIALAAVAGGIQVSTSGAPTTTKTVLVNQLSDFPNAVGGVRTLETDTEYFLTNDITTSDRFVLQNNTVVNGTDILIGMFEYTGTADFFTGVDATCKIKNIQLRYLTANQCLNISNSSGNEGTDTLIVDRVSFQGTTIGTLTSLANFQVLQSSFSLISVGGFTFTGTNWTSASLAGFTGTVSAGTLFDIGTTTFDRFSTAQFSVDLAGGTTFLSGTTGSGNINSGGDGSVVLGRFSGAGTILDQVTEDDALWSFALNDQLSDSRADALLSMQGNATPTVIGTQSVGVLLAGTWVIEETSRMTGTTAGRATYDGGRDAKLPITSSVTVEPVSGGAQLMGVCIAIDGVAVPGSLRTGTASAGSPISITVPWQETFATAGFAEVFVSNESTTTNVLGSSAIHRVN